MNMSRWIVGEIGARARVAMVAIRTFLSWFNKTRPMTHYRRAISLWPTTVKLGVGALFLEGFVFTFHRLIPSAFGKPQTTFVDIHAEIIIGVIFIVISLYAVWKPKMGGLLAAQVFYIFALISSIRPYFSLVGFIIWSWMSILAMKDTVKFSMLLLLLHQRDEEAKDVSE